MSGMHLRQIPNPFAALKCRQRSLVGAAPPFIGVLKDGSAAGGAVGDTALTEARRSAGGLKKRPERI